MTRPLTKDPVMTHTDNAPLSFEAAGAFPWIDRNGVSCALGDLEAGHLHHLESHLVREIDNMEAQHDDFMLWQLDPEISSGFYGIEDRLVYFEETLRHLRALKAHRAADTQVPQ